jgi:MinD-like ATPase involved in chromosome partitioning or flagellar assembly
MTIQILRLKDGSDVICNTESISPGILELQMPMMFSMVNQNLVLQHWLPLAAMKGNSVKIPREEIVCYMEPNDEFSEYYNTAVNKLNKALEPDTEEEIGDIIDAMDELENTKGISIH